MASYHYVNHARQMQPGIHFCREIIEKSFFIYIYISYERHVQNNEKYPTLSSNFYHHLTLSPVS